jgi:hypothetical protein
VLHHALCGVNLTRRGRGSETPYRTEEAIPIEVIKQAVGTPTKRVTYEGFLIFWHSSSVKD